MSSLTVEIQRAGVEMTIEPCPLPDCPQGVVYTAAFPSGLSVSGHDVSREDAVKRIASRMMSDATIRSYGEI